MSTSWIVRPSFAELEQALFGALRAERARHPLDELNIVVGSNYVAIHLRRLLAVHLGGHANLRIRPLYDLAQALALPALLGRRLLAGPAAWRAGVALARQAGGALASLREHPALGQTVIAGIQRLRLEGLRPRQLSALAGALAPELVPLWQAYEAGLQEWYDEADLYEAAAAAAARAPERVIVYGLYDLSPGQRRFMQALTDTREVTWLVPKPPGAAGRYVAAVLPASAPRTGPDAPGTSVEAIGRILNGKRPVICSCPGEAAEAQEIARRLRQQALAGRSWQDMAVVPRTLEPYGGLLSEALTRAGIPFHLAGGQPLSDTATGRSFLQLLDVLSLDFSRSATALWWTSTPLDPSLCPEPHWPARWDELTAKVGITRGHGAWREGLAKLRREVAGTSDQPLVAGLTRLMEPLFALARRLQGKTEWQPALTALIETVAKVYAAGPATEALQIALEGLATAPNWAAQDIALLPQAAARTVQQARLPVGRFQRDGVLIADVMTVRGLSFATVILPGLVEKVFPAAAQRDPLLKEDDRSRLGLPAARRLRAQEELTLFALALQTAREEVILTYPRQDPASGRERLPSTFLLDIAEAVHGLRPEFQQIDRPPFGQRLALGLPAPSDPLEAATASELALALLRQEHLDQGNLQAAIRALAPLRPALETAVAARQLRWQPQAGPFDGALGAPVAVPGPLSASALERLATCPFQFLAVRIWGIGERTDPEEEERLTGLDRGTLLHAVLTRFLAQRRAAAALPLTLALAESYREDLLKLLDEVCQERERQGVPGAPLYWRLDRDTMAEDLIGWLQAELKDAVGWEPQALEWPFAMTLPLRLADGKEVLLELEGRIDRIDCHPQLGMRVIDYKTGRTLPRAEERLAGGTLLQLPIYLRAVREATGTTLPTSAFYASVSRRTDYRREALPKGAEALLEQILSILLELWQHNLFIPYPGPHCSVCPVRPLCPEQRDAIFRRKQGDARLQAFLALKEVKP